MIAKNPRFLGVETLVMTARFLGAMAIGALVAGALSKHLPSLPSVIEFRISPTGD
jgi:hypothetical protein